LVIRGKSWFYGFRRANIVIDLLANGGGHFYKECQHKRNFLCNVGNFPNRPYSNVRYRAKLDREFQATTGVFDITVVTAVWHH
jgi:hypothetical protein